MRVTRSQRNANSVDATIEINTITTPKKSRRRQRKNSDSSEKSVASTGIEISCNKTSVKISPSKVGKFEPNQHSPSTRLEQMSLGDKSGSKSETKLKNKIDEARKILDIGETDQLYGREKELADLNEFLETNVKHRTSASMYISGQPGK